MLASAPITVPPSAAACMLLERNNRYDSEGRAFGLVKMGKSRQGIPDGSFEDGAAGLTGHGAIGTLHTCA